MSNDTTLARELGAIASGEDEESERVEEFAIGLERLIDERIALNRAGERNPPSDADKPAAVAVGDTVDHGHCTIAYYVTDVATLPDDGLCAQLSNEEGAYHKAWVTVVDLLNGGARHHGWRLVRAVDVPNAAEPEPRKTYWICAGENGCIGSGVLGGPRPCPNCRKPCIETYGNGQPVEPVPGVVAVGDTFLRLTKTESRFNPGMVGVVTQVHTGFEPIVHVDGVDFHSVREASHFLTSGDWQRVPAGYVLPTVTQCLDAMRRLVAARDKMSADPATGTHGIDDCIAEMRLMAGMVAR